MRQRFRWLNLSLLDWKAARAAIRTMRRSRWVMRGPSRRRFEVRLERTICGAEAGYPFWCSTRRCPRRGAIMERSSQGTLKAGSRKSNGTRSFRSSMSFRTRVRSLVRCVSRLGFRARKFEPSSNLTRTPIENRDSPAARSGFGHRPFPRTTPRPLCALRSLLRSTEAARCFFSGVTERACGLSNGRRKLTTCRRASSRRSPTRPAVGPRAVCLGPRGLDEGLGRRLVGRQVRQRGAGRRELHLYGLIKRSDRTSSSTDDVERRGVFPAAAREVGELGRHAVVRHRPFGQR